MTTTDLFSNDAFIKRKPHKAFTDTNANTINNNLSAHVRFSGEKGGSRLCFDIAS